MSERLTYQQLRSLLVTVLAQIQMALRSRHEEGTPCPPWMRLLRVLMRVADPRTEWEADPEQMLEELYRGLRALRDARLRESLAALGDWLDAWHDPVIDTEMW
jgi:hypothetical protein